MAIRAHEHVNQFLYDNRMGLEMVFSIAKEHNTPSAWSSLASSSSSAKAKAVKGPTCDLKGLFTFDSGRWIFERIQDPEYEITTKKIEQCFQFGAMTVLNDPDNPRRYLHLEFVEFLDMLCRICIVGVLQQDTLDYNLHFLLGLIYSRMDKEGLMARLDWPLHPVDE